MGFKGEVRQWRRHAADRRFDRGFLSRVLNPRLRRRPSYSETSSGRDHKDRGALGLFAGGR
jgi:hypothetical protein